MIKWGLFSLVFSALIGVMGYLYFTQETRIFSGAPLAQDTSYPYLQRFEELLLETGDGGKISALHFKIPQPKGVVLYFHGRGGNLLSPWGQFAFDFTSRGYDCFMMDYRSFGKSTGSLSEHALLDDASRCYTYLADLYPEDQIVIYGRSLGSGMATYVAAHTHPKMLLLESPYFSLRDLIAKKTPYLPRCLISLLLKYPICTNLWIPDVLCPIYLIHTKKDEVIPYDSSVRLFSLMKDTNEIYLISIAGGRHQSLSHHSSYQFALDAILR